MRSLGIGLIVCLLSVAYAAGDDDMKSMCSRVKAGDKCKRAGFRKNCPEVCADKKPDENQGGDEKTTKQAGATTKQPTTKKPENSGGGNKKCDKRSPCIPLDEANANFRKRCEATNGALKATCYPHCRYDEDTATMKKAFMGGPCPLPQLRTYLTAAANSKDNTACCADTGVMSQKKTGLCGCFCYPTGPVWPQKGEAAKYAPCVGVLTGIMQCHYYAEGAD